ncbi:MAG: pilus assembly protein [Elusimicrobia bacterium]|nr:pilus assembly protein [Elusimicrobiota bacterium]
MIRQTSQRGRKRSRGQVLVEVLLMLPVFLLLIFTVMETGHLAFRTILLHHAAYEAARIGSLTASAYAAPGCPPPVINASKMSKIVNAMFPPRAPYPSPQLSAVPERTLTDPQEGCPNYDVKVTVVHRIPMIFPMTGFILSNTRDRQYRTLVAEVRMPIERPLFK